jgi:endo-1,3(4)-beta-glucanase
VSNIDRDDLVFGDAVQPGDPPKFFSAPLYVQQVILSATELGANTHLTTDSHKQFSININLRPAAGADPLIRFPIVQGMGFVSGLYATATPLLQSNVLFTELIDAGTVNGEATFKYRIKLKDDSKWLLYVTPNGATGRPPFVLQDSNTITGPGGFTGLIQIAKNIDGECAEIVHDEAAGAYPISAAVSASVEGAIGTYSFTWSRGGSELQKLLMYALPHHVKSMTPDTIHNGTCALLWTSTKGLARGIHRDSWTLQEKNLPVNIDFDPWRPDLGTIRKVANEAVDLIADAASYELAQDIDKLTNLDSAYYGGKVCYSGSIAAMTRC